MTQTSTPTVPCQRRRFSVTGVVQGVGFRPFVHRVATELGLSGFVGNDSGAVFIEVQGPPSTVAEFSRRLVADAPPLAALADVFTTELAADLGADAGFQIVASRTADGAPTAVPADIAVCDDCVAELFNPSDRRYRHPFITCTNCGPRFTIIRGLPYDRPATTMADFPMCERCAADYHDPANRRFHAQPNACPDCGPSLWFAGPGLHLTEVDAALAAAQSALADGKIVAIKGIGGYHLACSPDDGVAVAALRQRKARRGKPFAVLVRDLEVARRYADVSAAEAAILTSPPRPIVLLRRRTDAPIAAEVAPGNPLLGLLLPYTPIHHLLLSRGPGSATPPPDAVVLTSANRSDDPICYTDDDAAKRLPPLTDAVLDHNRPIHVPCDDSVVRVVDERELPIRRSRGYVPLPVDLRRDGPPVLAVGAELKNTFCLTDGRRAFCSAHIGDMGTVATLKAFTQSVRQLCQIRGQPMRLAADLHPRYVTRNWADHIAGDRPLDLIQHHHAHVVSLLAEHQKLGEPIIGVAFDGTGYGCDDTVWGGEILRLGPDSHRFTRIGHLAETPLAGGDVAVRNPWRMALAHLWQARMPWTKDMAPVQAASAAELRLLRSQFATGRGCVPTTSMGRLFDAVASLLGVRQRIDYEGQAAIELEVLAASTDHSLTADAQSVPVHIDVGADGILDPAPMFAAIVGALRDGVEPAYIASSFHHAVATAVAEVVGLVADGTRTVGLTGGVFQNVLLLGACRRLLEEAGFTVLTHRIVPPNDGGLALGQAAISTLTALEEGTTACA
ncbi:hydrogenase maturation factor, HypF [Mycobacterium lentiflavum]|uniref:Carbamoyltransferase n=1 Tax=Mycobacterium lentiflavum TaxID=141349 RepID=A0A0E3WE44_MYCLN|nr:carbamoyltransferase HypF [Mycobacterium lentiflavum]CQD23011.1 hydrogenase maturation factor, HypF [Mycobacterium lentiflavum]